jgi:predicted amidohydrolase
MQDLNVTLVQANQVWEDKKENMRHFEELLTEVEETDIIVLPEMFHTGFTMNAKKFAEEMKKSSAISWLQSMAAKKNAAIYTSFIAKEDDYYFNRGVFVEPSGKFTHYDKRKLFTLAGEEKVFKAGHVKTRINYKGWKIQLQICYDLRFPEITRNGLQDHKSAKFDALLYVANWPEKRNTHWKALLTARAIENQCFVIGVNRIGVDGNNVNHSGDSLIINPRGEIINKPKSNEESIETIILNKNYLNDFRKIFPVGLDADAFEII